MPAGNASKETPQNGSAIRDIRQREGLTVTDLAGRLGISDPHMRNIELENKAARPELLALIARELRCSLSSIARRRMDVAS
jgi:transcriptional regulator with XRE-family HTH domain